MRSLHAGASCVLHDASRSARPPGPILVGKFRDTLFENATPDCLSNTAPSPVRPPFAGQVRPTGRLETRQFRPIRPRIPAPPPVGRSRWPNWRTPAATHSPPPGPHSSALQTPGKGGLGRCGTIPAKGGMQRKWSPGPGAGEGEV